MKNLTLIFLNDAIRLAKSVGRFVKKSKDGLRAAVARRSARLTIWMNRPRPWLMPLCMALMAIAYWAQLHGYGLPITMEQWSRK